MSPLELANANGHPEIAELLRAKGAKEHKSGAFSFGKSNSNSTNSTRPLNTTAKFSFGQSNSNSTNSTQPLNNTAKFSFGESNSNSTNSTQPIEKKADESHSEKTEKEAESQTHSGNEQQSTFPCNSQLNPQFNCLFRNIISTIIAVMPNEEPSKILKAADSLYQLFLQHQMLSNSYPTYMYPYAPYAYQIPMMNTGMYYSNSFMPPMFQY